MKEEQEADLFFGGTVVHIIFSFGYVMRHISVSTERRVTKFHKIKLDFYFAVFTIRTYDKEGVLNSRKQTLHCFGLTLNKSSCQIPRN